jgi:hypothetical protein
VAAKEDGARTVIEGRRIFLTRRHEGHKEGDFFEFLRDLCGFVVNQFLRFTVIETDRAKFVPEHASGKKNRGLPDNASVWCGNRNSSFSKSVLSLRSLGCHMHLVGLRNAAVETTSVTVLIGTSWR